MMFPRYGSISKHNKSLISSSSMRQSIENLPELHYSQSPQICTNSLISGNYKLCKVKALTVLTMLMNFWLKTALFKLGF